MNYREKLELAEQALAEARPSGGEWLRSNCPFCSEVVGKADRKQAFSINRYTGWFHCFRCGTAGRIDRLAEEAIEERPAPKAPSAVAPPEGFIALWEGSNAQGRAVRPAVAYLAKRGVGPPLIAEAHVGCCISGKYAGRVVVPVLDSGMRHWLGWVSRAWAPRAFRPYLNLPGPWRGGVLYNHAAAHVATDDPLFVVEGVFDALALWPNAAAVLGKPSASQVDALACATRPVVALLDGDAWEESLALALKLRLLGQRAGAIRLPPMLDPDEVDRADLWEAARTALSSSDAVQL